MKCVGGTNHIEMFYLFRLSFSCHCLYDSINHDLKDIKMNKFVISMYFENMNGTFAFELSSFFIFSKYTLINLLISDFS